MKETGIMRKGFTTLLATVFAVAIAAPTSSMAGELIKGGRHMTQLNGTSVKPVNVNVEHTMACPACKNVTRTRSTTGGRGAGVKTTKYTQHLCGSCKTTIAYTGHGKAKELVRNHTCNHGGDAAACN